MKLRQTISSNPVRRAYEIYFGGTVQNQNSADQIALLVAARGTGERDHPLLNHPLPTLP